MHPWTGGWVTGRIGAVSCVTGVRVAVSLGQVQCIDMPVLFVLVHCSWVWRWLFQGASCMQQQPHLLPAVAAVMHRHRHTAPFCAALPLTAPLHHARASATKWLCCGEIPLMGPDTVLMLTGCRYAGAVSGFLVRHLMSHSRRLAGGCLHVHWGLTLPPVPLHLLYLSCWHCSAHHHTHGHPVLVRRHDALLTVATSGLPVLHPIHSSTPSANS
jgi:hypothetical protein